MNLLLENVAKHVNLTPEEQELFLNSFTRHHYPAKTLLLKEGEVSKESIFVLSGILRNYCINYDLAEHTLSFASTGWWIADMYSFLTQQPGQSFIEVVEEAEVLSQTYEQRLKLFDQIPKIERFQRILIERSLIANQQRLMNNLSLPAEERYEKFCERFPDIIYRLPQKQIASYLGITPQFFSKMKRKILKGE